MHPSGLRRTIATALALLLITTPAEAHRLMESDGIELRGTARVPTYGAAIINTLFLYLLILQ